MKFNSNLAIYLQIAEYICEKILTKKWTEEDRIPSVREMAVDVEVNPNTVMRTYAYLQDKGIIFNKRGIGYFIDKEAYKNTLEMKKQEFVKFELPQLFKLMNLLKIDLRELEKMYNNFLEMEGAL